MECGRRKCTDPGQLPAILRAPNDDTASVEQWAVVEDTYTNAGLDTSAYPPGQAPCGITRYSSLGFNKIIVFSDRPDTCQAMEFTIAHEFGHVLRLDDALNQECAAPTGLDADGNPEKPSIMSYSSGRAMSDQTCEDAREELDRTTKPDPPPGGGGGDPGDGGGSNPGGGSDPGGDGTDRCTDHPNTPGCPGYCANNPEARGCGTVTTQGVVCIPIPGFGWVCLPLAPPPGGNDGRDGNGWELTVSATGSPGATYGFTLGGAPQNITVSLTGMNKDIDCRVNDNPDTGAGGSIPRSSSGRSHYCTNWGGTSDDSWSGQLGAGAHSVRVYPYRGGSGNYTITVSGDGAGGIIGYTSSSTPTPTPAPVPTPPPLTVPVVPDSRLPSGGSFETVLPGATGGTSPYFYSVSGLPAGVTFVASTRRASGTLPTVTTDTDYTATYTVTDSASASASVTFVTTVVAPSAPSAPALSGSVSGRTQTLTWTAPAGGGITRYQLQTRASAAHAWRFTGAGTPSPSSSIGSSVRSWSVVTPWTLVRHYQVRATNAVGDGAWSNVVALTTPSAPPPPLSVPGIPNFRLPSGGSVNTVFPAATGGTAPYVYRVSGLPPGITFVASTRGASGTLPTVTTETDYTITYTATDSASASASVTFVATVRAPPPPPPPPSAPQLSGSVLRQTQSLSWTAPASVSAITRYQMQTRNSAAHSWRYTTAGSPSPSSNFSSTARSWSVTTPSGLLRHYRVRATSANGDGAWSNVVELTSN